MTSSQILHLSAGAAVGVSVFFVSRGIIGNAPALFCLIAIVMPFVFFGTYEKNDYSAKKWLFIILRHMIYPKRRIYKTQNFYSQISTELTISKDVKIDCKTKQKTGNRKQKVSTRRKNK